jgi:HK97 family phage major capsid protein
MDITASLMANDPTRAELRRVRERGEKLRAELAQIRRERAELEERIKASGRDPLEVVSDPKDPTEHRYLELAGREHELRSEVESLAEHQSRLIVSLSGEAADEPDLWAKAIWPHVAGAKGLTDASYSVPPPVPTGVVELPSRAKFVRQLIPSVALEIGDRFAFMRQTTRTLNAAPVAAGATKPTSIVTVTKIEDRVRTIAHVSEPIDRFALEDFAALRDFLDGELRLGLLMAEDAQIISGSGTGENMTGILNTAGILSVARGAGSRTDAIRKAITALEKAYVNPTVLLAHPDDTEALFLEKDSGGQFLFATVGSPIDPQGRRVWGLQVVSTMAMPQGTALVADFNAGARLYVRDVPTVEFNSSHSDLFVKNQVIARCEERVGLAVLRPMAFCQITGF